MIKLDSPRECIHWNDCSASICPFDKSSIENCVWYPDEETCKLGSVPRWVKNQKKIAKLCRDIDTYFNYEMLNRNCVIKGGIKGIDPNREEDSQLENWLRDHPLKKKYSEQRIKQLKERMKSVREAKFT